MEKKHRGIKEKKVFCVNQTPDVDIYGCNAKKGCKNGKTQALTRKYNNLYHA